MSFTTSTGSDSRRRRGEGERKKREDEKLNQLLSLGDFASRFFFFFFLLICPHCHISLYYNVSYFAPCVKHHRENDRDHEKHDYQVTKVEREKILGTEVEKNSSDYEYDPSEEEASCSHSRAKQLNSFCSPPLCDLEHPTKERTDQ